MGSGFIAAVTLTIIVIIQIVMETGGVVDVRTCHARVKVNCVSGTALCNGHRNIELRRCADILFRSSHLGISQEIGMIEVIKHIILFIFCKAGRDAVDCNGHSIITCTQNRITVLVSDCCCIIGQLRGAFAVKVEVSHITAGICFIVAHTNSQRLRGPVAIVVVGVIRQLGEGICTILVVANGGFRSSLDPEVAVKTLLQRLFVKGLQLAFVIKILLLICFGNMTKML